MTSSNLNEKANFTRLCRLLVDKGTEALKNALDAIHPPGSLPGVLNANRKSLLRLRFRVINSHQWDLLFPPSGNLPDSKTFDVTLLNVLLRNICGLPPPATGWDKTPPVTDISQEANITRIKLFRNQIYAHVSSTLVDDTAFENLWQDISRALVQLKTPPKEIDDLKTGPLGPGEEMYVQSLKEWFSREENCKHMLVDLQQHLYDDSETIKTSMQHLTQTTEENRQGIQQLCQFSSMQSERARCNSEDSKADEKHANSIEVQLLQKLAKHNFKSKIRSKVKSFHPGTRDWLLQKVENWFTREDESRLLLITAGPGFGKSVFAAKVCEHFKEKEKLAACHFCDFSDSNLKDPRMMLESLACQMCENVPGFKEKLLDQLKRPHKVNSLKDAFQIYLQNPLDELEVESRLIVIDGLDESATADKSDVVKLIADHFPDLPRCVKVLFTSRPELSLQGLNHIRKIEIDENDEENKNDLLKYLNFCLPSLGNRDETILWTIVFKSEGSFLYAFHCQHELGKHENPDSITIEEILFSLPEGMGSVYQAYFRRLEIELEAVINKKVDMLLLLELLVATQQSLPLKFIALALDLPSDCLEMRRIINKVNGVVSCLLDVSDDEVTVFHKSVYDWLLGKGCEVHEFSVSRPDGIERLWLICKQIFEEIKENVTTQQDLKGLKLTNERKHALQYGHLYLTWCMREDGLHWLVDMIIILVLLTVYSTATNFLQFVWQDVLRGDDVAISLQLRQRISWHLIEMSNLDKMDDMDIDPCLCYLESVLDHSPKDCFTDDERKFAEVILADSPRCVKRYSVGMKCLKALLAKPFSSHVTAIGVSSSKKLAAVATEDGTICIVSLPDLVELFQHPTGCEHISCCTFAPEDSVVLYGKLETALSIAEEKEISFFTENQECFESCSFSPQGKRLVTSNGSNIVKLWDVAKQSLLSKLFAGVALECCSFSKTGLFIIGYMEDAMEDSYCVWNAITFQRVDVRSSSSSKVKTKDGLRKSERCNRCFGQTYKELFPLKSLPNPAGIYNEVDCSFCLHEGRLLIVVESVHFTTLAAWRIFGPLPVDTFDPLNITAIEDDLWFYADEERLVLFTSEPSKENQSYLSRPTLILWCSFSPDSTRLASCTSNGSINVWNVDTCQVYQRFRCSIGSSSAACWWSDKHLFVCNFNDEIPSLSKYPVDENLNIAIAQMLPMSLCPVVNQFLPFSGILDFSEGYISFECGEAKPVQVLDVNKMGKPKIVVLPEIRPKMSIAVSFGASFVLGTGYGCFFLWKRNEADTTVYDIFKQFDYQWAFYEFIGCHFSDDSKFAVSFLPRMSHLLVIDLAGFHKAYKIRSNSARDLPAKVFCTNKVVVLVTSKLIEIFDLKGCEFLGSSFQRHLIDNSVINPKLSPKGTVLALPTLTGDMEFFQIRHPESF